MPTKRELREAQEEEKTQEISVEEIQKEIKKQEAEDGFQDLDVPNFTSRMERPKEALKQETESYADDDEDDYEIEDVGLDKPLKIMIGVVIAVVLFIIAVVAVNLINTKPDAVVDNDNIAETATPDSTAETNGEISATTETSITLDYYYEQSVISAITSKLSELYGNDGYTKPSSEQIKISGSQSRVTASCEVTVGDSYSKNYIIPAEFQLEWNDEEGKYEIVSYTVDDEEATKSGFKAHTSKKQAEKTAKESANTEGSEVSNFEVTVRNSVTVTITGKGSGTVTAYAISEDGVTTELASASGGTVTKTVDLESGQYKLVLYATEGAGYSWNYQLG